MQNISFCTRHCLTVCAVVCLERPVSQFYAAIMLAILCLRLADCSILTVFHCWQIESRKIHPSLCLQRPILHSWFPPGYGVQVYSEMHQNSALLLCLGNLQRCGDCSVCSNNPITNPFLAFSFFTSLVKMNTYNLQDQMVHLSYCLVLIGITESHLVLRIPQDEDNKWGQSVTR